MRTTIAMFLIAFSLQTSVKAESIDTAQLAMPPQTASLLLVYDDVIVEAPRQGQQPGT